MGDEFQALYADAASAFEATLLLRLWLPEGLDTRFGIGAGSYRTISTGPTTSRTALPGGRLARPSTSRRRSRSGATRRCAPGTASSDDAGDGFPDQQTACAYLISRDYIVGKMRPSTRAMLRGSLVGQTQTELAKELGITQGTVSSAMRKSGPSIVIEGVDQIRSRWGK